jgi:hypothetical protein
MMFFWTLKFDRVSHGLDPRFIHCVDTVHYLFNLEINQWFLKFLSFEAIILNRRSRLNVFFSFPLCPNETNSVLIQTHLSWLDDLETLLTMNLSITKSTTECFQPKLSSLPSMPFLLTFSLHFHSICPQYSFNIFLFFL